MVMICCSVPKKIRDYLDGIAEECEDTRSEVMRLMLLAFYDRKEWEAEIFPEEEGEEEEEEEESEEED